MAQRPFRVVGSADQWWRAHHEGTALDRARGTVSLAWTTSTSDAITGPAPDHAGLAFDRQCRLYRVQADTVTRVRWAAPRPSGAPPRAEEPLLAPPAPRPPAGGFAPTARAAEPAPLRGIAIDDDDRLFVGAGRRVLVFDLWSRRHLRTVRFADAIADLVFAGRHVRVLLENGAVHRMTARSTPVRTHAALGVAVRALAVDAQGQHCVLTAGPDAQIRPLAEPSPGAVADPADADAPIDVPGATDLLFDADGVLIVAREPGRDFLRMRRAADGLEHLPPLKARGYDGAGIALAPDGRVVYFTADRGLRHARAARLRYAAAGRVVSFRLDSGGYRTTWGRVFLDACVPPGTSVRIRCVAVDEAPAGAALAGTPPGNLERDAPALADPPPQMPLAFDDDAPTLPLVRRADRELPWARFAADDPFTTYEAHAITAPGRFLWVVMELRGDTRRTPRVRMLRVEAPGHAQLARLPAVYRREPAQRDFLQRFLALFDGVLHELELRSLMRLALVDPHSTPAELLPWLASFLGLVLDERWTEAARRQLVAEAATLFRRRGTQASLLRMIELALGHISRAGPSPVIIIEQYRFRGLGAVVGEVGSTRAVLGGGYRVGGAIGVEGSAPLEGTAAEAFDAHAHRFTVVVQGHLGAERRAMLDDLLSTHAPAHTVWTLCAADAGMRIGRGLHLGLSTLIGPTGGFREAIVGGWQLGRGTVTGRPSPGMRVGTMLGDGRVG